MRKTFKNTQRAIEKNVEYATVTTKHLSKSAAKFSKKSSSFSSSSKKSPTPHSAGSSTLTTTSIATPSSASTISTSETRNSSKDKDDDVEMSENSASDVDSLATDHLPTEVQDALSQVDSMISRMKGLKRKIYQLKEEQNTHLVKTKARIDFLARLNSPDMTDIDCDAFKSWSRTRLEMLISDYCLREGMIKTAKLHSEKLGIENLVDSEELSSCFAIEQSLRKEHTTDKCQAWCQENRQFLKKIRSNLEFEIKLQQFIELARAGKRPEAIQYYRQQLIKNSDTNYEVMRQVSTLLAFSPDQKIEPYTEFYSDKRWDVLADTFVETFQDLHGLPTKSAFLRYLATGISALKTHSCDLYEDGEEDAPPRKYKNKQKMDLSRGYMCPVCSVELRKLAKPLPFALHAKSHTEPDSVVLGNNRIYGLSRLQEYSRRVTGDDQYLVDPVTMEMFPASSCMAVFPT